MQFLQYLLVVNCLGLTIGNTGTTMPIHNRLHKDLFQDYEKTILPAKQVGETLFVVVHFDLSMLRNFDDVNGEIIILSNFEIEWDDRQLAWNPQDYGGIEDIVLPRQVVWHPQLFLSTSLSINNHPGMAGMLINVNYRGKLKMLSTDLLTSFCSVDVTEYPNDYQTCELNITAVGYSPQQLGLRTKGTKTSKFNDNSQWKILNITTAAESAGRITIRINLKRRSMYAILTVTVPIFLLGIINPWVFLLPPESGERTTYSITTFLSFNVYMGVLTQIMPKGSLPVANLMFLVFIMLIYSVSILFCTVVSLRLYTNNKQRPVPRYLASIFNTFPCFQFRKRGKTTKVHNSTDSSKNVRKQSQEERFTSDGFEGNHLSLEGQTSERTASFIGDNSSQDSSMKAVEWIHVGQFFDKLLLLLFTIWFVTVACFFSF